MNLEDIQFPVYRKYKNSKSYFKIINPGLFEEVQIIGSRKVIKRTEARLFPEKIFVMDLISNYENMAVKIEEPEYLAIIAK